MSQIVDGYVPDPSRTVILSWKRYRVTVTSLGLYTLWYSGNILRMDRDRDNIIGRFKRIHENFEACAS